MIDYYRAAVRLGSKQEVRTISAPTLVIWGQGDRYLGRKLAEPHHEDVPNLDRVERLPDASHWVHHDEAERVSELLVDFLAPAGESQNGRTSIVAADRPPGHAASEERGPPPAQPAAAELRQNGDRSGPGCGSSRALAPYAARRRRAASTLQLLDQLRRLVHLDVDAEHRDAQRQPVEVVVGGRGTRSGASSIGSSAPATARQRARRSRRPGACTVTRAS